VTLHFVEAEPPPVRTTPAPATQGCRLCGADLVRSFADLGETPLAHLFITPEDAVAGLDQPYPLHARVCDSCLLVQVDDIAIPAELAAATAAAARLPLPPDRLELARRQVPLLLERYGLGGQSLVIGLGGPDHPSLLPGFLAAGVPVLGIDPDPDRSGLARQIGVPTEAVELNADTAMQVAAQHGRADLVLAHDALPRVGDLFGFAAGVTALLRPNGVAILEFPHLLNLVEAVQFDTIRHGYRSNLSLLVAERVLRAVGLRVFDAERLSVRGGTLRVYCCHVGAPFNVRPAAKTVRTLEQGIGLDKPAVYERFASQVAEVQRGLRRFLAERRESRRRVAAFGAGVRGNMLLNTCGVTSRDLICVADGDPAKIGRMLPGSHVPIVPVTALLAAPPDDLLILPAHRANEIAADLRELREAGTALWVAVPRISRV
jgi:hypothetical protein